jgi:hypothetical protein
LAGAFYLLKNPPKAALFWFAGCWNSSKFCSRALIQGTIVDFLAFLEHGSVKKITICAHTNRDMNKQEVGFIFE